MDERRDLERVLEDAHGRSQKAVKEAEQRAATAESATAVLQSEIEESKQTLSTTLALFKVRG